MERISGRALSEERRLLLTPGFARRAGGSVLAECGGTRVICSASFEDRVPVWMKGSGKGWLTAEYAMLPASSDSRISREKNLASGRTKEIQRLIGRSLRSAVDASLLGERTILVDCDVVDADGGTRTTSINGAAAAVALLLLGLRDKGVLDRSPMRGFVGAVSVGMVDGRCMCDLDYSEDSRAEVDMNVVMTSDGRFVEIQGTAERSPFSPYDLGAMLRLASDSIRRIGAVQAGLFSEDQLAWLFGDLKE